MSDRHQSYDIHLDDKFGHLTHIDVAAEAAAHEPWFNQTLTTMNNTVVRLGVLEGDFHWHKHDDTDEFFLVLDGPAGHSPRTPGPGVDSHRQAIPNLSLLRHGGSFHDGAGAVSAHASITSLCPGSNTRSERRERVPLRFRCA